MANGGSRRGLYGEGRRTAVAAETHSPPHVRRILHLTFRGPDQLAIRQQSVPTRVAGRKCLIRSPYPIPLLLLLLLLLKNKSFEVKIPKIWILIPLPPGGPNKWPDTRFRAGPCALLAANCCFPKIRSQSTNQA